MANDHLTKWEAAKVRQVRDRETILRQAKKEWKEKVRQEIEAKLLTERKPTKKKTIDRLKKKAKDYSENLVNAYAKGWNL